MSVRHFTLQEAHALQTEGIRENNVDKVNESKRLLEAIAQHDPDNWVVLFYLANCYLWLQRNAIAVPLLWRCGELCNYKQVEVFNNLGTAYRNEHLVDKAKDALNRALEITPNDSDALNNMGTLNINEGTPAEGIEYLERAIKANPGHKQAHWNLALCHLELENWEKGFHGYAWGVATKDRMDKDYNGAPWWNDWKPHKDKTICVYGEQGIGDEIMFFSMLPDLQKDFGRVIVDCHPRLINMFRRSFPGVTFYPTRKIMDKDPDWVKNEKIDYKQAAGHLGAPYRRREEDFPKIPYLIPNRQLVDQYRAEIKAKCGDGPSIVISWIGGHKKTRKDIRAIDLEKFLPIIKSGANIISGQYTEHDTKEFSEKHGVQIYQFPEVFCSTRTEKYYPLDKDGKRIKRNDYDKSSMEDSYIFFKDKYTAKDYSRKTHGNGQVHFQYEKAYDYDHTLAFLYAVHELGGMVISVNNSMVHLCGAAGIRCHTLTPSKPAWRYGLTRKDMVWYSSVVQYRQVDNWEKPIEDALYDAIKYIGAR